MRQPPAERIRFILILKMLGPLLAFAGERLGRRVRPFVDAFRGGAQPMPLSASAQS
jgi:hypothetical protein